MNHRWYFNPGRVPVPVHIGGGRQYAVKPRGYVYINVQDAPAQLLQCGAPKDADAILAHLSLVPSGVAGKDALDKHPTRFASSVSEVSRGTDARKPRQG